MPNRHPKNRTIRIHVDGQHKFHYTDLFDGSDAAHGIRLIDGDQLAWVLDSSIAPHTFQIDFDLINPFQNGLPISLRGIDFIVSPKVSFPAVFAGNRIVKYTVSLGNGWVDDPDVVPVPSDVVNLRPLDAPSPADCLISWVDANEAAIQLDPAAMSANATNSGGSAMVTWQWASKVTKPFTLEFLDPIPDGWPKSPTDSAGVNPSIVLYLPAGLKTATAFRITTTKKDGNDATQNGTLLIL
ncbi:MAG: hypothetical protein ABSC05_12245 [Candidatus Solibacter sp.]|jgi:hypothetical protein